MKLINKQMITMAAIATFFAAGTVYAVPANIPASVSITAPTLTLSAPTALDFGGIIRGNGAVASTVRVNSSTNVAAIPVLAGGVGDASLDGTGGSGSLTVASNINATLTISCTSVTGTNASGAGTLDTFATDTLALLPATVMANTPTTLAIVAGTPATLYVGGSLTIANTTVAGDYEGTIVIDVAY